MMYAVAYIIGVVAVGLAADDLAAVAVASARVWVMQELQCLCAKYKHRNVTANITTNTG